MAMVWIPGIGNVVTPDNPGDLPPGARIITPVVAPAKYDGGSSPVTYAPPSASSPVTVTPNIIVTSASSGPSSADVSRASRLEEMKRNNVWDNIPEVRALEVENWQLYVETGRWNNPKQLENHKQAENIRKSENPMYSPHPWGPMSKADANSYALPSDQFVTSSGIEGFFNFAKTPEGSSNILGMGLLAIMAIAVISFVKG